MTNSNDEKDNSDLHHIRDLESSLYSRNSPVSNEKKSLPVTNNTYNVPEDWEHDFRKVKEDEHIEVAEITAPTVKKSHPMVKKILLISILFFVIAAGYATYQFFGGSNVISADNIDMKVVGSATVGAGEPYIFDIVVRNQNNIALDSVFLSVEYPDGTRDVVDVSTNLPRQRMNLGSVEAYGEVTRKFQAVLYGEESSIKPVKVSLDYRVSGSSASLFKEIDHAVTISSAPVRMFVSMPDELNSNQDFDFTADISSNSSTIVKDILFKVDYGFGFTFGSGSPQPTFGNDTWRIGDLRPGEKRSIRIRGRLEGQDGEKRVFKFSLGVSDKSELKNFAVVFLNDSKQTTIKKPFLSANITLDGSASKTLSVSSGQRVRVDIDWVNNLTTRISDLEIEAKIEGAVLDRTVVSASQGFYRSLDNTVVWNKDEISSFSLIDPGEEGTVSFTLASLPLSSLLSSSLSNQEIKVMVTVKAKRLADSPETQSISTSDSKTIRIGSSVDLSGRVVYSIGPFKNTGLIPPKVERETSFTAYLTVTNSLNDVSDGVVTAVLPSYVEWLDVTSPGTEKISYNKDTRTVTWTVGDIKARTGFSSSPREVAFQVSILPSLSQVGSSPVLVKDISFTSYDRFANWSLKDTAGVLSTDLRNDPQYSREDGRVVQ